MANEDDSMTTSSQQAEETAAQIELVMNQILSDHPHLRVARDSVRREDEPADKFAREFLRVFRHRLQS